MKRLTRLAGLGLISLALTGGIPAASAHEGGHKIITTDAGNLYKPVYHRSFKADNHRQYNHGKHHRNHGQDHRGGRFIDRHDWHHNRLHKYQAHHDRHFGDHGRRDHHPERHHKHRSRWSIRYGYY